MNTAVPANIMPMAMLMNTTAISTNFLIVPSYQAILASVTGTFVKRRENLDDRRRPVGKYAIESSRLPRCLALRI